MMKHLTAIATSLLLAVPGALAAGCGNYTGSSCVDCLEADCAYSMSACIDSCENAYDNTDCFSIGNYIGLSGAEVCKIAGVSSEESSSTGVPIEESPMEEGSTSNTTDPIDETPIEESSTSNTTDPCNGLPSCESCLNARMMCVWTAGSCERECLADADCWSPSSLGANYANMTGPEICMTAAEESEEGIPAEEMEVVVGRQAAGAESESAATTRQGIATAAVSLMALFVL